MPGLKSESEIVLVEDPYTEKESRMHVVRTRELLGAAGDRIDNLQGIDAGLSLHDSISAEAAAAEDKEHSLFKYDIAGPSS